MTVQSGAVQLPLLNVVPALLSRSGRELRYLQAECTAQKKQSGRRGYADTGLRPPGNFERKFYFRRFRRASAIGAIALVRLGTQRHGRGYRQAEAQPLGNCAGLVDTTGQRVWMRTRQVSLINFADWADFVDEGRMPGA